MTTPADRRRTTWPTAEPLQQAADIRRTAGDPLLADWFDETANALSWLAPFRDNEPGYGMWEAAAAVARQVLGTAGEQCPQCGTSGACNGGPCPLNTTDRPGAETGFVCKCPQGCCGHGQQKAVAALCGCDPAPHREEDGTYSHYAGCPVADAQQKFGHHVD